MPGVTTGLPVPVSLARHPCGLHVDVLTVWGTEGSKP